VHKLKLTGKQGDVSYFYFDASTGLIMKWHGTRKVGDKRDALGDLFSAISVDVDGLKYPFLVESAAVESDQIQKITATKIRNQHSHQRSTVRQAQAAPAPPAAPADPPKPD